MKKVSLVGIVMIISAMAARLFAINGPTEEEILTGDDRVRNPDKPFRVTLALNEYINGKARDRVGLVVYAKLDRQTEQFNDLVRYAEPRRDAGKMVLLKGTSLWFYDPASKASIRISPQQRLVGQASEGDVLTVNLAKGTTQRSSPAKRPSRTRIAKIVIVITSRWRPPRRMPSTTASNTGSKRARTIRSRASSTPIAAAC